MIGRQSLTPHSPFFMKTTISFTVKFYLLPPLRLGYLTASSKDPKLQKFYDFFENISLGVSSKDKDMKKGC